MTPEREALEKAKKEHYWAVSEYFIARERMREKEQELRSATDHEALMRTIVAEYLDKVSAACLAYVESEKTKESL